MKRIQSTAVSIIVGLTGLAYAPVARAEDTVTYDIFSDSVGELAGVEYRDTSGKHLLQDVPLPWTLTVPVVNATSPTRDGAELRADWRPNFRTAATVARVLQGHFVTVRIMKGDDVLCESILDLGNATCYGSVPHTAENESSPGNLP
ncbi:hypothetical protein TUM20985_39500 [Mycobacterium antarcticum]|uniref:hypothetical protein n=1 Tax=unclassified Mycolicibacterium TaxID=2636767 RepID=UPI002392C581|nr:MULTISPECIES: hypothetical protein [unclassified Mycolicibacterium]BDX33403.1 hypothetical protein TUM20985_39500 [Mycolicibacterium sp. TUM20985]GLP82983.1 hypothetical protein TUM20984_44030 [Mycolicibacterium sp. TUM20984]